MAALLEKALSSARDTMEFFSAAEEDGAECPSMDEGTRIFQKVFKINHLSQFLSSFLFKNLRH